VKARALARRLRRDPRRFVLEIVPTGAVCAEIGVWKGEFSAQILKIARPSKLHLIDPWAFMTGPEYAASRYGGGAAADQRAMDDLHAGVLRRFGDAIERGIVEVHRCESARAADRFPDGSFDWVYVDGNHLYEHVREDLARYGPKVKPGGFLAGDDYGVSGWWRDGVTRAVDEFVSETGCKILSLDANQFVLRMSRQSTVK
jgi:Methyltransferase domain